MNDIIIRNMTADDVSGVVLVENNSFKIPWSEKSFKDELENSLAVYFVVESENKIIGYCGMWDVSGEGDITNIAVLPEFRGKGVGRLLLSKMFSEAKKRDLSRITLEVRESNTVAINLYTSFGFEDIGMRKNYYADNGENAIIMSAEFKEN